jgi:hypothetical protein
MYTSHLGAALPTFAFFVFVVFAFVFVFRLNLGSPVSVVVLVLLLDSVTPLVLPELLTRPVNLSFQRASRQSKSFSSRIANPFKGTRRSCVTTLLSWLLVLVDIVAAADEYFTCNLVKWNREEECFCSGCLIE